MTILIYIYL